MLYKFSDIPNKGCKWNDIKENHVQILFLIKMMAQFPTLWLEII